MIDLIVIAVLLLVGGAALWYVIRAKKKGVKCIGCAACKDGCEGCCHRNKE